MNYICNFNKITINDIPKVGGKNASLGEMFQNLSPEGILIPDGFAVVADGWWHFLETNSLEQPLADLLSELDTETFENLAIIGQKIRALLLNAPLPKNLQKEILAAFNDLKQKCGQATQVAVRSSATAEDLPEASFAGQQESYLNIQTEAALLDACHKCYASLYTNRAIKYRIDNGFDHLDVALSIGIQQMVRSDKACAGVCFTIEPDSGFENVVVISSSWGLGENVVKGNVDPDEYIVFKPSLKKGLKCILFKKTGRKEKTMVYGDKSDAATATTINLDTPEAKQKQLTLSDEEVETIAQWSMQIEAHYGLAMDIEWAKDGLDGKLYIVQARPETVHATSQKGILKLYHLTEKGRVVTSGIALGNKITTGKARILNSPDEAYKLNKGEVLVTDTTDPDWDPILKKVAAVITNRGGRTSHAAIVARELGAVAIVGAGDATKVINDGQEVTISCAEGKVGFVYEGILPWEETNIDTRILEMPKTKPMLILGDPDKAFQYANLPNAGVGLMRMEFIINNAIQIHPMALVKFDELENEATKRKIEKLSYQYQNKPAFFVDKLSQAIAIIAAAFFPKPVIVRMSDFKSNEYANLIGGQQFEPKEANPMLGFRGASRYYHPLYREGFQLECEAIKIVRNKMGLTNVKLMIPFCRTVDEGRKVIDLMAKYGLPQGENSLEIYTMIEIPSNVILANDFAEIFDGFSIGSNDLTQLALGLDRDNSLISNLFDENNKAIKLLISSVTQTAKSKNIPIGLCGQAPSDFPKFAQFLVQAGIDNISFTADALWKGIENIKLAEDLEVATT